MHLGLLLVIALLVFGPKKLPEIGRELGQAIREFKRASREVMESFHEGAEDRSHSVPAYDAYRSPVAEGPSMPGGPPPGTVDRSAHAVAKLPETAAASPTADHAPAAGAATNEPARAPVSPERNT
jgi:sec-independent protein translocase protein TatA